MSFWIYILRCADGTYYTGHTDNLEQRLAQHQSGAFKGYTFERRPVELMFSEYFQTRVEALDRERQIKDWSKRKKEALFKSDWRALSDAAQGSRPRVSTSLDARSNQTERAESPEAVRFEPVENGISIVDASKSVRFEPVENHINADAPKPVRFEPVENHLTPPPVIVLVRPQLGENIGKAARAMLNFGLAEMRLVAPRDGWPNPSAGPAASGADIVLERAQVFASVADAVADCQHVYATTVRKRGVTKPVVTPEEAARAMRAAQGRSAILFGPERSGLETDDVAIARTILTVPINPEFGSLNLAQAVILVAYEWSKGEGLASPPSVELDPPAPQEELDGMLGQLDAMLEAAGYFFPPDRAPSTRRTLRTLLTKPGWNSMEVRTLRGVLSSLANPRQR